MMKNRNGKGMPENESENKKKSEITYLLDIILREIHEQIRVQVITNSLGDLKIKSMQNTVKQIQSVFKVEHVNQKHELQEEIILKYQNVFGGNCNSIPSDVFKNETNQIDGCIVPQEAVQLPKGPSTTALIMEIARSENRFFNIADHHDKVQLRPGEKRAHANKKFSRAAYYCVQRKLLIAAKYEFTQFYFYGLPEWTQVIDGVRSMKKEHEPSINNVIKMTDRGIDLDSMVWLGVTES